MQRKTVHIAGWLFADLLLGLAMLFITSMVGLPIPTPAPTLPPGVTPSPTATQTPTPTATVTLTRSPTVASRGTPGGAPPTPTLPAGINPTPFVATFRADPNLVPEWMQNPNSPQAATARNQISQQMHACLDKYNGLTQASVVLNFGGNPNNRNGDAIALEANQLLRKEFPSLFGTPSTVFENFHSISASPSANGTVKLKIYFVSSPTYPRNPIAEFGTTCMPPPTWCLDASRPGSTNKSAINVFNWPGASGYPLYFTLRGMRYEIASAEGQNPAFRCFLIEPGIYNWNADLGNFESGGQIEAGKSMNFCVAGGKLKPDCTGEDAPSSAGQ